MEFKSLLQSLHLVETKKSNRVIEPVVLRLLVLWGIITENAYILRGNAFYLQGNAKHARGNAVSLIFFFFLPTPYESASRVNEFLIKCPFTAA